MNSKPDNHKVGQALSFEEWENYLEKHIELAKNKFKDSDRLPYELRVRSSEIIFRKYRLFALDFYERDMKDFNADMKISAEATFRSYFDNFETFISSDRREKGYMSFVDGALSEPLVSYLSLDEKIILLREKYPKYDTAYRSYNTGSEAGEKAALKYAKEYTHYFWKELPMSEYMPLFMELLREGSDSEGLKAIKRGNFDPIAYAEFGTERLFIKKEVINLNGDEKTFYSLRNNSFSPEDLSMYFRSLIGDFVDNHFSPQERGNSLVTSHVIGTRFGSEELLLELAEIDNRCIKKKKEAIERHSKKAKGNRFILNFTICDTVGESIEKSEYSRKRAFEKRDESRIDKVTSFENVLEIEKKK